MAAGEGNRMRPLTENRPKVMLPFAGKPMLEHLLTQCRLAGISDFIFVVGYHAEKIREYFKDGAAWGVRIRYVSQPQPQGTADAVRHALPMLSGSFMVLNGDVVLRAADLVPMCRAVIPTIGIIEMADVSGMGVVETSNGCVTRLYEKTSNPPTRLVNTGCYFFTPEIYAAIAATPRSIRGEYEITDTIQYMIDAGLGVGYHFAATWRDIGYPWNLLAAGEDCLAGLANDVSGQIETGVVIKGPVHVGEGSVVKAGSYITGPVIIGKNCDIGPNCYLRTGTTIGDHCHIGAGVEIKNSIIMNNTRIPHLTYVGDSIIGENCNLGAGTQIANLRFDGKNIQVEGRDSGRRKFGAVLGDQVSTGVNTSINPGTFIGGGTRIGPGSLVSGYIAPGSRIF
jgi:bifunctional UDP-N-acetylglucosamine pyrophosphorylase/glucosamine-1-phosphate N-acetyltransferase